MDPATLVSAGGRKPRIVLDEWCKERVNTGLVDISNAIVACCERHGACQLLPGTYAISPTAQAAITGATLFGSGRDKTKLVLVPGETGIGLRLGSNSTISDLTIEGNLEASTTGMCPVSGGETYNVAAYRCGFANCNIGVADNGVVKGLTLLQCLFNGNVVAGVRTNSASELINVLYSTFIGDAGHIELQASPIGGLILGNTIEGGTNGIQVSSGKSFTVAGNRVNGASSPITAGGSGNEFGVNWTSQGYDGPALVNSTLNTHLGKFYRSSLSGLTGVWKAGDTIHVRAPSAGQPIGFRCVTAGDYSATPPVWISLYAGSPYLSYSGSWNPGAISAGDSANTQVTVAGAAVGDYVLASFSQNLPNGAHLYAQVVGTDTVDVGIFSTTGQTISSGTLKVRVIQ